MCLIYMEKIYTIKFLVRNYVSYNPYENERIIKLPVILQDHEGEYLVLFEGDDAIAPWHVGDEIVADLMFRVEEHYGRACQTIYANNVMPIKDFWDGIAMTKGGER